MTEETWQDEDLAEDLNNEISERDGKTPFFKIISYGNDHYGIELKNNKDIYKKFSNKEGLYIFINYETAIDEETLIITLDYNINDDTYRDSYVLEGYNPSDILLAMTDLHEEFLYKIYNDNPENILSFSKEDIDLLTKIYPEIKDNIIKSVKATNKYNLFDFYQFTESKNLQINENNTLTDDERLKKYNL